MGKGGGQRTILLNEFVVNTIITSHSPGTLQFINAFTQTASSSPYNNPNSLRKTRELPLDTFHCLLLAHLCQQWCLSPTVPVSTCKVVPVPLLPSEAALARCSHMHIIYISIFNLQHSLWGGAVLEGIETYGHTGSAWWGPDMG